MTAAPVHPGLGDLLRDTLADHLGTAGTRIVVLAMSKDDNPKVTVLAFAGHEDAPRLVIKVAMTEGASTAVRAEAAALRRIEEQDRDMVGGTVPRCVEERRESDRTMLVATACPGVPMQIDYHRWRHTATPAEVRADFACARDWLDALARLQPPPRLACANPQAAAAAHPDWARRIVERWPGDALASAVAAGVARATDALGPAGEAVVHGDFWCGNVLRGGGRVTGVVDWEHAAFGGDPIRDRVRFAVSYALYLDRHTRPGRAVAGHPGLVAGRWGEPIRYAAQAGGWFPTVIEGFIGDGLAATGRPRARWRDALALGLAEIAVVSDNSDFARRHLELAGELLPCR
jgi:hypothetical protein